MAEKPAKYRQEIQQVRSSFVTVAKLIFKLLFICLAKLRSVMSQKHK